ncbi:WW domain-binding protein 11 [Heterocephalus glaber]|uniref:WW domain-binding protein 11 n=1 Tax=Heterocephalus glaber TaxID=10181 RepID=G5AZB8_HETGA|nr:WW domain-binding protein 11 [Heterocephalus glaber]
MRFRKLAEIWGNVPKQPFTGRESLAASPVQCCFRQQAGEMRTCPTVLTLHDPVMRMTPPTPGMVTAAAEDVGVTKHEDSDTGSGGEKPSCSSARPPPLGPPPTTSRASLLLRHPESHSEAVCQDFQLQDPQPQGCHPLLLRDDQGHLPCTSSDPRQMPGAQPPLRRKPQATDAKAGYGFVPTVLRVRRENKGATAAPQGESEDDSAVPLAEAAPKSGPPGRSQYEDAGAQIVQGYAAATLQARAKPEPESRACSGPELSSAHPCHSRSLSILESSHAAKGLGGQMALCPCRHRRWHPISSAPEFSA